MDRLQITGKERVMTRYSVSDISVKTFFGRGSGESIQMKFEGEGFVVIQPCEEATAQGRSE
jgi:uncharacterized protein (AIM24 family)